MGNTTRTGLSSIHVHEGKKDELLSLEVKSLICEEADDVADLPVLWHGQKIGEIGPIKPLSEHVRQEPHSLPKGFKWVALSSRDIEEVVQSMIVNNPTFKVTPAFVHYYIKHPNANSEWQFGVTTASGKLIGTVMAFPVCLSIGGISVTFIVTKINCHSKYQGKRLEYVILYIKELMRRANLDKINQMIISLQIRLFKPVVKCTSWRCDFPIRSQIVIAGWTNMTPKHVPSALAFVNKYTSRFEIRLVITSEEEFGHFFLCPGIVDTYIVEHEDKITDFASFRLIHYEMKPSHAYITTVISTRTPVKVLISNAINCAMDNGAGSVAIAQGNLNSEDLRSLDFSPDSPMQRSFYNYKYHKVSQANYWFHLD